MNSTYGTVRPSLVNPEMDVEIWYHYRPSRGSEDGAYTNFKKLDNVSSILVQSTIDSDDTEITDYSLPGMYSLNLPVEIFGKKGIYTIYIKPRDYFFTIKDIGSLAAFPDVRGVVLDLTDTTDYAMFNTDNLVGYRVDYFEADENSNLKRQEYFRLITSNNFCEPVSQNLTSANTKSNGYRFNDTGTLVFLTLTPSTNPSFKASASPFIGIPNQRISITNTKFDPVMIEVEMVEHDIETLTYNLEGEQVRNLENGRLTTYNTDGEIYKQFEFSVVKDNYTTKSIAEIKVDKSDNIDTSLDLDELKGE